MQDEIILMLFEVRHAYQYRKHAYHSGHYHPVRIGEHRSAVYGIPEYLYYRIQRVELEYPRMTCLLHGLGLVEDSAGVHDEHQCHIPEIFKISEKYIKGISCFSLLNFSIAFSILSSCHSSSWSQ